MNHGSGYGFVHGFVFGLVHGLVSGTRFIVYGVFQNVLLEHGGLPCISMFTLTLETIVTLSGT